MKTTYRPAHYLLLTIITTLVVGSINTACAMIAYQSFIPRNTSQANDSFIDSSTPSVPVGTTVEITPPPPNTQKIVRTNSTLGVGTAAVPASVTTKADGTVVYKWCSGNNPNLEDGVCEAISSITSSPTTDNPHLSQRAKDSLSLMPPVSRITMDESSWQSTSSTSGNMRAVATTADYGDVNLLVTLEKSNGIWVLTDGALAQ